MSESIGNPRRTTIDINVIRRRLSTLALIAGQSLPTSTPGTIALIHVYAPPLFGRTDVVVHPARSREFSNVLFHDFF